MRTSITDIQNKKHSHKIMKVIKSISHMQNTINSITKPVGLVPTMGSIHEGHIKLIESSKKQNATTIVTLFINPTQFGKNEDFNKYPRNFQQDKKLLSDLGVDILFAPETSQMYPKEFQTNVINNQISSTLEGEMRPEHFTGVLTVVSKLLNITKPNNAYFGQKDFQQLLIINKLNNDLNHGVKIISIPTVRENDGLALSSRNMYLSKCERKAASKIYASLKHAKSLYLNGEINTDAIINTIQKYLVSESLIKIEYISIRDKFTFEDVYTVTPSSIILIAVYIGKTRLIDNLIF
tara:strand:- start:537 stop:1418 length:882 start_codon:yes stop_codon:yes gene_type:complete